MNLILKLFLIVAACKFSSVLVNKIVYENLILIFVFGKGAENPFVFSWEMNMGLGKLFVMFK